jgi:molecular chaperone GrpE
MSNRERELQEQIVQMAADFDNLKRKLRRERREIQEEAECRVFKEILPIFDNLNRAVHHAAVSENSKMLIEGVKLILKDFCALFDRFGLRHIETEGKAFDPAVHEAISEIEDPNLAPGTVAKEILKGYILNNKLLRPAVVIITKASTQNPKKSE